jgi:para-aminobenzoate synthetase component I
MLKKITYSNINADLKANLFELNRRFDKICYFNSNSKINKALPTLNDQLIAIGCVKELIVKNENKALEQLQSFYDENKSWIFGALSYDLKNEIEDISSQHLDDVGFPLVHFFIPEVTIQVKGNDHFVYYDEDVTSIDSAKRIYDVVFSNTEKAEKIIPAKAEIKKRISKEEYLKSFNNIRAHVMRGDIYEINFCQEFYSDNAEIDPVTVFEKLNAISEAPFAAFCKFNDQFVLSSSPERFLKKEGPRLITQPIKGTAKRAQDIEEDEKLKTMLKNDPKEQNENVMIVDLVRNDLSRVAKKGSVKVDELFGVYSFRQVHQLISTVSCELKDDVTFIDILKSAFPMGSMTGAPKVSAMKLIEKFESTKRGIYSGALGYISPEKDFDFSVVIRSIIYNSINHYLSFMVGSAITANAEAEKEYEECMLKAKAMLEVLK